MRDFSRILKSQETTRCLIIQLGRLGDSIQNLMALRAAKQLYPQLEISILVREKFSSAVTRVPWIKNVYILPTEKFISPILKNEQTLDTCLPEVTNWFKTLNIQPWDILINWTFSETSSFLATAIPAKVKLGFTRRTPCDFATVADGWSQFVQAVVQSDVPQNIHLIDILTTQLLTALQIHLGDPSESNNSAVNSKNFFSLPISSSNFDKYLGDYSKKWLAIQLGSSKEESHWDAKKWAELAQYILSRHTRCGIFLLGSKDDIESEKTFFREMAAFDGLSQSIVSLVGQTDFDLWTTILSRCQWLFSADTAAIQIASVLGTRVLNVSCGLSRFHENGPYGNGHYVVTSSKPCEACETIPLRSHGQIQQKGHSCSHDISAESVYAIWAYSCQDWSTQRTNSLEDHFYFLNWDSELDKICIYRTQIRNTMDGGGVAYLPVIKKSIQLREWTSMAMGYIARSWYCGWLPPIGQELNRETLAPALIQSLREMEESVELLLKVCKKAIQISQNIQQKCASLRSQKIMRIRDREELQEMGNGLRELENLIDRLANTHRPLLAFSQVCKVQMHNLKGIDLIDLSQETTECYIQLHEGSLLFQDWIKYTLTLIKPIPVHNSKLSFLRPLNKTKGEFNL